MQSIKILLAVGLVVLIQACANPSIVKVNQNELSEIADNAIIYVPRFEGKPDFVEESTDYFTSQLELKISHSIIQGSVLRAESTDIEGGGNLAPLALALSSAKENGAEVLITGKVTSHSTAGSLNGFSTIRVYNVKTGKRIANFHRPSGKLIAYSEHQCVMEAVERTAEDVANMFNRI